MAKFGDRMNSNGAWEVLAMWYAVSKLEIYITVTPVQVSWGNMEARDVSVDVDEDGNILTLTFSTPDVGAKDRIRDGVELTTTRDGRYLECEVEVEGSDNELTVKVMSGLNTQLIMKSGDPKWDDSMNEYSAVIAIEIVD